MRKLWLLAFIQILWIVFLYGETFFQNVTIDRNNEIYKNYDAPIINSMQKFLLTPNGELFETYHQLIYINYAEGLSEAQVIFPIGDSFLTNEYNVRIIKKDGTIKYMGKKNIHHMVKNNVYGFDNSKKIIIDMSREADVGDLIEWYVVYQCPHPQLGSQLNISTDNYIENYEAEISIPDDTNLKYFFKNEPTTDFIVTQKSGKKIYTYTEKNIEPFVSLSQTILVQYPFYFLKKNKIVMNNWVDFGFWISSITRDKTTITPDIQKIADKIVKDTNTKHEKIQKIYDYVRTNVRYVQAYLKDEGFIPHTADSILKNKYGDCKDYAVLIITLLKAVGIDSYYTLVLLDEQGWNTDKIVYSKFNHAIVYIPDESGPIWLDGTNIALKMGEAPSAIINKYALIIGKYEEVKLLKPKTNEEIKNGEQELYYGLVVVKKQETDLSDTSQSKNNFESKDSKILLVESNRNNSFTLHFFVDSIVNNNASGYCELRFTNQYTQPFELYRKSLNKENFHKYVKREIEKYFNPTIIFDTLEYDYAESTSIIRVKITALNLLDTIGDTVYLNMTKLTSIFVVDFINDYETAAYTFFQKVPVKGNVTLHVNSEKHKVSHANNYNHTHPFGTIEIKNINNAVVYELNFDFGKAESIFSNIDSFNTNYSTFLKSFNSVRAFYKIKE